MDELSDRETSTPSCSAPVRSLGLRSPVKRTSVVGDTSTFLTALAAQERRVLELREELEKEERNLSKLKKQWSSHEFTKKDEFRRQEPLQQLKTAYRTSSKTVMTPDDGIISSNLLNHRLSVNSVVRRRSSVDGKKRPLRQNSVRQMKRKVFAGSRHIKALSLLSATDDPNTFANRAPCEPTNQAGHVDWTNVLSKDRSPVANTQRPFVHSDACYVRKGQPKEVFIETGKQLVGDLREGLWTFFEDLRQATIGEEAIGNADHRSKTHPSSRCIVRAMASREEATVHTPRRQPGMENKQPCSSSDVQLVPLFRREQQMGSGSSQVRKEAVPKDSPRQQDEDEDWDTWDTPIARSSTSHNQAESVTSDSLASSSTGPSSPRSFMR